MSDQLLKLWRHAQALHGRRIKGWCKNFGIAVVLREIAKPGAHLLSFLMSANYDIALFLKNRGEHHTMK